MRCGRDVIFIKLQKKEVLLYFAALLLLLLSFQGNVYNAASDRFFETHQRDSEALVLGRIIETVQNGYLSQGGFMGRYSNKDAVSYTYKAYEEGMWPGSAYSIYTSSAGFQGVFYGLIDSLMNATGIKSGKKKLFISKFITSSALASLVAFFIIFAYRYLGLTSALTALFLLLSSQWLVVFSNNLYWMFFLVVLPFFIPLFFLDRESTGRMALNLRHLCFALFAAVFIKSLAGYEYISTILIAMVVPFVFFSVKDKWGFKQFIERLCLVSISGLAGFFSAILLHVFQLSFFLGDLSKGLDVIWMTVVKRTHGNPYEVDEVFRRSLESSISEVILKYWNGVAFDLDSIFGAFGTVRFGEIIILALALSVIGIFFIYAQFSDKRRLHIAILSCMWLSMLAPLSWYVLAKGHSYIHVHMNHVLWYVPFLFFVFAYFGFVVELIVKWFSKLELSHRRFLIVSVMFLACSMFLYSIASSYYKKRALLASFHKLVSITGNELSVNYFDDNLIYVSNRCDEELDDRFFLHIIPDSLDQLPKHRKQHGFDNLDFNWSQKESVEKYWFIADDVCVATVALPAYPLKGIRTGQFNKDGRLWVTYIDLENSRFVNEIHAFDLTDENCVNGISRDRNSFFVANTFQNRQTLRIGDTLIFSHSGERVIEQLAYSARYINIFVSGGKLNAEADGYPNAVGLKGSPP